MQKEFLKVDTRAFDSAMREYKRFNKRVIPETLNTKVYFISRNAVNTTRTADKEQIRKDLLQPSKIAPGAPLASVLVNRRRVTKGKTKGARKGLTGEKMKLAVESFIKMRQRTVNFLRAGWQASIIAVEPFVKKKGGAPKYTKVKVKGAPKGGGKPAMENSRWISVASIWNSVQGGKTPSPQVEAILEEGLAKAVQMETKSMLQYIEKQLQEGADKFNRS